MCAIAGMVSLDNKTTRYTTQHTKTEMVTIFSHMMRHLHGGGRDASGIFIGNRQAALSGKGSIGMYKDAVPSNVFLEDAKTKKLLNSISPGNTLYVVGHARAGTTGDDSNENNHPFKSGSVIGVHNGMLNNHQELAKKEVLPLAGECDSEVIFSLFNKKTVGDLQTKTENVCRDLSGWYACALVDTKDFQKIVLFKDGIARLHLLYSAATKLLLFCTFLELMVAAVKEAGIDPTKFVKKPFADNTGVVISTYDDFTWEKINNKMFSVSKASKI